MSKTHDVIVIGAGPAGATTSYFLARQGFDVLMLDKFDFPREKTCGDGLTPRALAMLDEIGVLEEVIEKGHRVDQATVFSPKGASVTTRIPERMDLPSHILVIPRLQLDSLIQRTALDSGVQFHGRIRVTDIEQVVNGVVVKGQRGRNPFTAMGRLAVVAIGASTKLLLRIGILKAILNVVIAARSYFEDVEHLTDQCEFHLDGIPLPGYGWIFPLSPTSANVGAGVARYWKNGYLRRSAKDTLQQFLHTPAMREKLGTARQIGPVKSFPIRIDFATAPTFGPRMLLVGESAGLVNPLSGEGVDYALESGKIAAEHITEMFHASNFSQTYLEKYDRTLRKRYQRQFVFNNRIRKWYLRKLVIDRLVIAASRRSELKELFINILMGHTDAAEGLKLRTILKIVLAR